MPRYYVRVSLRPAEFETEVDAGNDDHAAAVAEDEFASRVLDALADGTWYVEEVGDDAV